MGHPLVLRLGSASMGAGRCSRRCSRQSAIHSTCCSIDDDHIGQHRRAARPGDREQVREPGDLQAEIGARPVVPHVRRLGPSRPRMSMRAANRSWRRSPWRRRWRRPRTPGRPCWMPLGDLDERLALQVDETHVGVVGLVVALVEARALAAEGILRHRSCAVRGSVTMDWILAWIHRLAVDPSPRSSPSSPTRGRHRTVPGVPRRHQAPVRHPSRPTTAPTCIWSTCSASRSSRSPKTQHGRQESEVDAIVYATGFDAITGLAERHPRRCLSLRGDLERRDRTSLAGLGRLPEPVHDHRSQAARPPANIVVSSRAARRLGVRRHRHYTASPRSRRREAQGGR